MQNMNKVLAPNIEFIDVGWVLFVPKESKGLLLLPSATSTNIEGGFSALIKNDNIMHDILLSYWICVKFVQEIII